MIEAPLVEGADAAAATVSDDLVARSCGMTDFDAKRGNAHA